MAERTLTYLFAETYQPEALADANSSATRRLEDIVHKKLAVFYQLKKSLLHRASSGQLWRFAMSDDTTPNSEIVLYQTEDGRTRIECRFEDESIWLTRAHLAELFQITVPTVNEHL